MSLPKGKLLKIIQDALDKQKSSTITILSSLLAVQDAVGYIPKQAIELIAERTNSTLNDVWGVASFYTNFRFKPPAESAIEICWGPSCHLKGSQELIKACLDILELDGEGDTKDGKITFKYNTCLAACAQAPVININHKLRGRMSTKELIKRIGELKTT